MNKSQSRNGQFREPEELLAFLGYVRGAILWEVNRVHLLESICSLQNIPEDLASRLTGLTVGPTMKGVGLDASPP